MNVCEKSVYFKWKCLVKFYWTLFFLSDGQSNRSKQSTFIVKTPIDCLINWFKWHEKCMYVCLGLISENDVSTWITALY